MRVQIKQPRQPGCWPCLGRSVCAQVDWMLRGLHASRTCLSTPSNDPRDAIPGFLGTGLPRRTVRRGTTCPPRPNHAPAPLPPTHVLGEAGERGWRDRCKPRGRVRSSSKRDSYTQADSTMSPPASCPHKTGCIIPGASHCHVAQPGLAWRGLTGDSLDRCPGREARRDGPPRHALVRLLKPPPRRRKKTRAASG